MFKIFRVAKYDIQRPVGQDRPLWSAGRSPNKGFIRTVEAEVEGRPYEFTSFDGGRWEIYDHPRSSGGVPSFNGYMPEGASLKLEALARKFANDRSVYAGADTYDVGEPVSRKPRSSRTRTSR